MGLEEYTYMIMITCTQIESFIQKTNGNVLSLDIGNGISINVISINGILMDTYSFMYVYIYICAPLHTYEHI